MLDLAGFCELLRAEFDLDDAHALPSMSLVGDLGFDSFELFRVLILMESILPGFELPAQFDVQGINVRDLYHLYSLGGL